MDTGNSDRPLYVKRRRFRRLYPIAVPVIAGLIYLQYVVPGPFPKVLTWICICFGIAIISMQEFALAIDRIEYPRCPLCADSSSETVWQKDHLAMVRCDRCGLLFASPRYGPFRRWVMTQYFGWVDIADKNRRAKIFGPGNFDINIHPKLVYLRERGFDGSKIRLLDAGSGPGAFLKAARDAGFRVTGIEPAWCSALWGKVRLNLDIKTVKLEDFHPREPFDVIVSLHVIEHLPDPLSGLKNLAGMCGKDGVVLIATPNAGCRKAKELGVEWEAVGPAEHLFLFDKDTLTALVERAGMSIVELMETGEEQEEIMVLCRLSGRDEG
jgi:SAM-dependent methyltransferase